MEELKDQVKIIKKLSLSSFLGDLLELSNKSISARNGSSHIVSILENTDHIILENNIDIDGTILERLSYFINDIDSNLNTINSHINGINNFLR